MLVFLVRRLLATIPVLVIVAVIVFLGTRLAPGDPAAAIVGNSGTSEDIARVRIELGLDRPLPVQFGIWTKNLLNGELGRSYYMQQPVSTLVAQRLEPTISLAALTLCFAVLVAVPLGILAAWRHGAGLIAL